MVILRSIDDSTTFAIRASEKTTRSAGAKRQGNLEDVAQHNTLGEVFQMLRQAKTFPRSKNYLIKNLNGDVLTTEAECLDHWAEHFQ